MRLLYEVSVREKAFYAGATAGDGSSRVNLMRVASGNHYYFQSVLIKPLAESLLSHETAIGSLVGAMSSTGATIELVRMSRYRGVVTCAPTPALPEIIQTGLVYADQATGRGNTSVGAMAASVLMDVLRNGSERDVDDLLERLLTHPGNHAGNASLINGMSGDGIGRGATSSKVDIARHSLSSARGGPCFNSKPSFWTLCARDWLIHLLIRVVVNLWQGTFSF